MISRLWLAIGLLFAFPLHAADTTIAPAHEVATRMDELSDTFIKDVTTAIENKIHETSYTTVWRDFEDDAIDALCASMREHISGFVGKYCDKGEAGSEKNRLADLAIRLPDGVIEVSLKAARNNADPENDMGTFRDHANREKLFVASFTVLIRYDDSGKGIKMERVYFDRTYRFVGKSTLVDGVKYRKKDGNMRPKSWTMFDSGESFWKNPEEFEAALQRSAKYRAQSLVREHLASMSDDDQRTLYEELKAKFEK